MELNHTFVKYDHGNYESYSYKISIQLSGKVEIDLQTLDSYYFKNETSILLLPDSPFHPIRALDIVLKSSTQKW